VQFLYHLAWSKNTEIFRLHLRDPLREDARRLIDFLRSRNLSIALLSGDHESPCKTVASELGINEIYFLKSPEEKASLVQGEMMIGDGLNDALALSSAKVSIAVSGGMDAAVSSAQVYLLDQSLEKVHQFLLLSNKVRKTISTNFRFSTSYNIFAGILSLMGLMNPLAAAVIMPLSAVTVFTYSSYQFRNKVRRGIK